MRLSHIIIKLLQKKYWGVGFESNLPPEFVITNHAKKRIDYRLANPPKHEIVEMMINAWYDGKEPPDTFLKDKIRKPISRFDSFIYRYHAGYIWIWGLQYSKQIPSGQKHLVTIYYWKK